MVTYATTYPLSPRDRRGTHLTHTLKNLCHSHITTAHRHLSIYVHIAFMRFLYGLQRFVSCFICLKSDTNQCEPHDTPSTRPLEDQKFYISFSLACSHSCLGKNRLAKHVSQGTLRCSTLHSSLLTSLLFSS